MINCCLAARFACNYDVIACNYIFSNYCLATHNLMSHDMAFRGEQCKEQGLVSIVIVLYLVSLLFALPILHPTNHFLDREVFKIYLFICYLELVYDYFSVFHVDVQ